MTTPDLVLNELAQLLVAGLATAVAVYLVRVLALDDELELLEVLVLLALSKLDAGQAHRAASVADAAT